jgi:hypothetical protein
MDVWATKTRAEREQDEDERLVRPKPSDKPPRHDLRREQVRPDVDPDADDASDKKDRSRNYKNMASVDLVTRYRMARRPEIRIPVKNRETDRIVMVAPSTLEEQPGKYQKIDHEDPRKEKPGKDPSISSPPAPSEKDTENPTETPDSQTEAPESSADSKPTPQLVKKDREQFYTEAGKALRELAQSDPKLESKLKSFTDPKSQVSGMVQENPELPADKIFSGVKLPEGIRTINDIHQALLKVPLSKAPRKNKPIEDSPPSEKHEPAQEKPGSASENPAEAPEADAPATTTPKDLEPTVEPEVSKENPEGGPKPKAPRKDKTKKAPEDSENKTEDGESASEKPEPTVAEKAGIAPPKRRPVNEAEREEAVSLLVDTFPPDVAAELISKHMHPDDVRGLVQTFNAAQKIDPKSVDEVVQKASSFYQTDPDQVEPPVVGKNAAGEQVSFDNLTPEEQSEATRQHQIQIAAMSLAAHKMLTQKYEGKGGLTGKSRIPKPLASALAGLVLGNVSPDTSDEISARVFDTVIQQGDTHNISDKSARNLLDQLKDHPAAKAAATAYLQANDYGQAKDKFLKGDDDALSEWQDPGEILKGLRKAGQFFDERSSLYGANGSPHPASTFFRSRVLTRLRALDPKKARMVSAALPALEEKEYREHHRQWEARYRQWEARRSSHDEAVKRYMSNPQGDPPGAFQDPEPVEPKAPVTMPKNGEDVWKTFNAQAPEKPAVEKTKKDPSGEVSLDDQERQQTSKTVDEKVRNPPKLNDTETQKVESGEVPMDDHERAEASKTVEEMIAHPPKLNDRQASDFTYPVAPVMGSADKNAVYHGIDPYAYGPAAYPGWLQPHQRDIGETDLNLILRMAKEWLKSPMLSVAVEGMVPDARFRAALDLAIYDSPYNRALNSNQYNQILAKLAGVPEPGKNETLLTVQANSHSFKTETRYLVVSGATPITRDILAAIASETFPFTDDDGKLRQGGQIAARVTRTVSASETPPTGHVAETVLRIDFPAGSESQAINSLQASLSRFRLTAEKTTPGYLPQFRASSFSPTPSVPTGGRTSMKASTEIRKFATEVAKSNPKLAFEMLASADRLAEEEKKMPPWLQDKIDDKKDEDKGQQKEASVKLGSLKTLIIKQAAGVETSQRGPWLPILQALKDLG